MPKAKKKQPVRLGAITATHRPGFHAKKRRAPKPRWRCYYAAPLDSLVSESIGIYQGPLAGTETEVKDKNIPYRGVMKVYVLSPTELELLLNNVQSNNAVFWNKFEVYEQRTPDGPLYPYDKNTTKAYNKRLAEAEARKDAKLMAKVTIGANSIKLH